MSSDIFVYIPQFLVISFASTGSGTKLSIYERMSVRNQEKYCNPALGDFITHILAADGTNFTQLCRWVLLKIQNVEGYWEINR